MECRTHDAPALDRTSASLPAASRSALHAAICDSCDAFIVGTRYHCVDTACSDFDLCHRCLHFEGRTHAASHALLVLPRPCASLNQLVPACQRFDATNPQCSCGSPASFVCSACSARMCDVCSPRHDASHALICVRSSRQNCQSYPHLPPLWASSVAQAGASPTTAQQRARRSTCCSRPMTSHDLDGVLAIEAASFTQPCAALLPQ